MLKMTQEQKESLTKSATRRGIKIEFKDGKVIFIQDHKKLETTEHQMVLLTR